MLILKIFAILVLSAFLIGAVVGSVYINDQKMSLYNRSKTIVLCSYLIVMVMVA